MLTSLKNFFFLLCIFSPPFLSAQNRWKNIELITATGDSINGEVSIKTNFKHFNLLPVRDKSTGEIKNYKPADVKRFVIKMDEQQLYFKTLFTAIDYSENELSRLEVGPLVQLVKDTVFAQLLVDGRQQLYYYKDNRVYKDHYLIQTTDSPAIELINKRYYLNSTRSVSVYNEEYKKQLSAILLNSPEINIKRINETKFSESPLMLLIKDYNTGFSNAALYIRKKEKIKLNCGLVIGASATTLKFSGSNKDLNQLIFTPSKSWNAGLTLNIVLPQTQKRWSIYNEVLYSSYEFSSDTYTSVYSDNWVKTSHATLEASYLKLFNAVRFQPSFGHFRPFVQAGIANGMALRYKGNTAYEETYYSIVSYRTTPLVPYRKYEQSYFIGMGICYRKFGLELRYANGNGMSAAQEIISSMKYYYGLLSYWF
jgi:hypothetical protein